MANYIACDSYKCFANVCGSRCSILTSRCEKPECPFFKTDEEVEEGRKKAHERLIQLGRLDLIDEYERNPLRRW